jgi:hypothetical protein
MTQNQVLHSHINRHVWSAQETKNNLSGEWGIGVVSARIATPSAICHGNGHGRSHVPYSAHSGHGRGPYLCCVSVLATHGATLTLTLNGLNAGVTSVRPGHAFDRNSYLPGDRTPSHTMGSRRGHHLDTYAWPQGHHDHQSHYHPGVSYGEFLGHL